jgi:hypothetical protein
MKKKQSKTSWWNKHCKGEQSGLVNEAKCTHWNEHEHILQLSWNRLRVLWYDNSRLSYFNEYFSAREKKNFPSIPPRLFLRSRFSSTYLYSNNNPPYEHQISMQHSEDEISIVQWSLLPNQYNIPVQATCLPTCHPRCLLVRHCSGNEA